MHRMAYIIRLVQLLDVEDSLNKSCKDPGVLKLAYHCSLLHLCECMKFRCIATQVKKMHAEIDKKNETCKDPGKFALHLKLITTSHDLLSV